MDYMSTPLHPYQDIVDYQNRLIDICNETYDCAQIGHRLQECTNVVAVIVDHVNIVHVYRY